MQEAVCVCIRTNKHSMHNAIPQRILQVHGKVAKDKLTKPCGNVNLESPWLINYDIHISYLVKKTACTSRSKLCSFGVWEMWVWLLTLEPIIPRRRKLYNCLHNRLYQQSVLKWAVRHLFETFINLVFNKPQICMAPICTQSKQKNHYSTVT